MVSTNYADKALSASAFNWSFGVQIDLILSECDPVLLALPLRSIKIKIGLHGNGSLMSNLQ